MNANYNVNVNIFTMLITLTYKLSKISDLAILQDSIPGPSLDCSDIGNKTK